MFRALVARGLFRAQGLVFREVYGYRGFEVRGSAVGLDD